MEYGHERSLVYEVEEKQINSILFSFLIYIFVFVF